MVESIYGGKTLPQYHERTLLQRRFSTGILSPSNLRSISEANDDPGKEDNNALSNREFVYTESRPPQLNLRGPNRPRAFSLPAIYRDGSYLRIKPAVESFYVPPMTPSRRFSEPGNVPSSSHSRHEALLSARSVSVTSSRTPLSALCPSEVPFEGIIEEYAGPRRHSDPTARIVEQVNKKHRIAEDGAVRVQNGGLGKVIDSVNTKKSLKESLSTQKTGVARPAVVRRMKCSLLPVPFDMEVKLQTKCDISCKRPQSYPPSKRERNRQQNLPEIAAWINDKAFVDKSDFTTNNNSKEKEVAAREAENGADTVKQRSNVEILTRWMKFFG